MTNKKAFFCIVALTHFVFWCVFLLFVSLNLGIFLSYEFAFFSVLLIIFSSFLNYKNAILKRLKNYKFQTFKPFIFFKKYKTFPKIVKFQAIKGDLAYKDKFFFFALFFGFFKLLAYVILVAGFLFLKHKSLLNILAFVCGISSLLICVFLFLLYVKKYEFR